MEDVDLAAKLYEKLEKAEDDLKRLNHYYEGKQPLSYMHPELLRELQGRVRQLVINWPRLVVDSLEERLDVEGFRLNDRVDDRMWGWWQDNGLDLASQHQALLVSKDKALLKLRGRTKLGFQIVKPAAAASLIAGATATGPDIPCNPQERLTHLL